MSSYTVLHTMEELEHLLAKAPHGSLLLLKHSTACPLSRQAHKEFVTYGEQKSPADPPLALVKVIEHRSTSNAIVTRFQVKHQSPQILLIIQKKVVWHASHWDITVEAIRQAICQFHRVQTF